MKKNPAGNKIRCIWHSSIRNLLHQKHLLLIAGFFLLSVSAFAQTTIRGTVKTSSGDSLSQVSITLKGTTIGTISDEGGRYSLSVPTSRGILVFSFVGYTTMEIPINGRSVIDIAMIDSTNSMNAVVVVGYDTQKKGKITGAISSITANELKTATQPDVINLMTGKLPGLRVAQRSGEPGSYVANFDIRGFGNPLVIVDGIPSENFRTLDPNEIESVSILKDASAAIYGVRAANGVVLITTKKGKVGRSEITYSGTFGLTELTHENRPLNAYENALLNIESAFNFAAQTNGTTLNKTYPSPAFTKDQLEKYRNGTYPSTDWYNLVVKKYTPLLQHNLSAVGGTDKVKYFFSLGYLDEEGLWKTGDLNYKKYSFRSNLTAKISNSLEAEFLVGGIQGIKNEPGETSAGVINITAMQNPMMPVYLNGDPGFPFNVYESRHPIAGSTASISGYRRNTTRNFNGVFALNYVPTFITGLKGRLMYSQVFSEVFFKNWKKRYAIYDSTIDASTGIFKQNFFNSPTVLTEQVSTLTQSVVQASLNYEKTFWENHTVKALAVYERTIRKFIQNTSSRQFTLDAVDQLYAGDATNQQATSTGLDQRANISYIGRLNYDYKGKYLIEGTLNYNGSSKFAPGHQWGLFSGVSGGWRISEEGFIQNNKKLDFITSLKLRASWGEMGDDGAINFQWLTGYNYPNGQYLYGDGIGIPVSALGFRSLPNENITWFQATTTDIGLDADFWQGKLGFTIDFFRRKRNGVLALRTGLPSTTGLPFSQENLNKDLSEGIDLSISHANRIGEVRYTLTLNGSYARNKLVYREQAPYSTSFANWRNNPIDRWDNLYFGLKYLSQFQNQEEIFNSPIQDGNGNRTILPGDLKYLDWNSDGVVDFNDYHPVGRTNGIPEIIGAFSIDLDYKGFDVNLLFQGATSFYVRYAGLHLESPLVWGRNGFALFMDRWHREDPTDPNSKWIPGKYPSSRSYQPNAGLGTNNYLASDYWLHDATYVRLKSVELGYTIPQRLINKIGIKRLRVYANAFNLLTWTGLELEDPELYNSQFGLEYPITKNYNIGVNLTF